MPCDSCEHDDGTLRDRDHHELNMQMKMDTVTSGKNPTAEPDDVASSTSPHGDRAHFSGHIMMDEHQRCMIENFSSAKNRRELEQRVQRCRRPTLKTFLFCFMPPYKVELILSHDCGLDVSNVDVEQLKKELRVSPQINIELLALAEESHFQQTAIVTVYPGDEISGQSVTSIITMFLIDQLNDDLFVVSTGHGRTVGEQLTIGRDFATVNLVELIQEKERPNIDVVLAKLLNRDVKNEVTIDGQLKILSQQVESSDDCLGKKVQKFREGSGDKKGIIRSLFSDGRDCKECLEIRCTVDESSIHDDGESGTLLVVVSPEADQETSVIRVEVRGIGILAGLYPLKFTNGKSRISSVAVPLDRTMDFLKSKFPQLQIFRRNVLPENIASSTSHSDGESLPRNATNGQNLDMLQHQGSDAGFAVQAEGLNGDAKQPEDLANLRTQPELCTDQQKFRTNESLPRIPVERCRPGNAMTSSSQTVKNRVYSRHSKDSGSSDQPRTGNTTIYKLDISAFTGRNTSVAKKQLKQLVYERKKAPDNKATVLTRLLDVLLRQRVTTMRSLPYELHEMLLKRSSCLFAKTLLKTDTRPDIQLFTTLSSVCRYFHYVLKDRRRRSVRFTMKQLAVVCRPYRLRPLLLSTVFGQPAAVSSLCTLSNKLYVHFMRSTIINVHTSNQPYTLLRHIQTPLSIIASIASCSINNCVYVAGKDTERRGVINRITKDGTVIQWLQNVDGALRLSVTSDGRAVLLIATDLQGNGDNTTWLGILEVYNSSGVKLTKLNLPLDIVSPWHAVQTANKTFLVSHGDQNQSQHRVCEVNSEGFVIGSYGGRRGPGFEELNTPINLARDSEERVIVADFGNRRVLLLNRQLNIERVLLTWSRDTDEPYSLLYEASEGRLFVGFRTGRLEIYSI